MNIINILGSNGHHTYRDKDKKLSETNLLKRRCHVNREQDVVVVGKGHQNSRSCRPTELYQNIFLYCKKLQPALGVKQNLEITNKVRLQYKIHLIFVSNLKEKGNCTMRVNFIKLDYWTLKSAQFFIMHLRGLLVLIPSFNYTKQKFYFN